MRTFVPDTVAPDLTVAVAAGLPFLIAIGVSVVPPVGVELGYKFAEYETMFDPPAAAAPTASILAMRTLKLLLGETASVTALAADT
jgi:hypothetical protein